MSGYRPLAIPARHWETKCFSQWMDARQTYKSRRRSSPSPLVVFRLVIGSTFRRISAAFFGGCWGFRKTGQAGFCFAFLGNGRTCEPQPRYEHQRTFGLYLLTPWMTKSKCIIQINQQKVLTLTTMQASLFGQWPYCDTCSWLYGAMLPQDKNPWREPDAEFLPSTSSRSVSKIQ